jgi:hypothetical protein
MTRVRVSTTVDADLLGAARRRLGRPDSELLDRALLALLDVLEAEADAAGLARAPYDEDPELILPVATLDRGLDYEGEIPADVVQLAEERRARRPEPPRTER